VVRWTRLSAGKVRGPAVKVHFGSPILDFSALPSVEKGSVRLEWFPSESTMCVYCGAVPAEHTCEKGEQERREREAVRLQSQPAAKMPFPSAKMAKHIGGFDANIKITGGSGIDWLKMLGQKELVLRTKGDTHTKKGRNDAGEVNNLPDVIMEDAGKAMTKQEETDSIAFLLKNAAVQSTMAQKQMEITIAAQAENRQCFSHIASSLERMESVSCGIGDLLANLTQQSFQPRVTNATSLLAQGQSQEQQGNTGKRPADSALNSADLKMT
jgi:hypothetical protein